MAWSRIAPANGFSGLRSPNSADSMLPFSPKNKAPDSGIRHHSRQPVSADALASTINHLPKLAARFPACTLKLTSLDGNAAGAGFGNYLALCRGA